MRKITADKVSQRQSRTSPTFFFRFLFEIRFLLFALSLAMVLLCGLVKVATVEKLCGF